MTVDEKLDHIIDETDKLHEKVDKHGRQLARIDERTQQHEKRMDRMDKKAAALGTGTGALGGILAMFVKSLFGSQ